MNRGNKVISGTFGALWINGEKFTNVKSFEAKVTGEFEDIKFPETLGTDSKYMGYKIEGTIVLHKTDSKIANILNEGFLTGKIPDFIVIAQTNDPNAGLEKVELQGVQFTEMTLQSWETNGVSEEETPFIATSYRYPNMIV